ncbi:MAG: heavy-metal-associated domain-containing protein [Lentisphaeria bacterium]|nr:heavy-metal-associated domain-containing protein [Lentisphaeria bacterium]
MKTLFHIRGMRCAGCSAHIEKDVKALNGIALVEINLSTGEMIVEYDENAVTKEDIAATVVKAGFKVSIDGEKKKNLLSRLFGKS